MTVCSLRLIWRSLPTCITSKPLQDVRFKWQITAVPLGQKANIFCFAVSFVEYCHWNVGLESQWNFIYGQTTAISHRLIWRSSSTWVTSNPRKTSDSSDKLQRPSPLRPGSEYFFVFAVSFVEYCRWNVGLEAQWNFIYGQTTASSHRLLWRSSSIWVTSKKRQDVRFKWQITGAESP